MKNSFWEGFATRESKKKKKLGDPIMEWASDEMAANHVLKKDIKREAESLMRVEPRQLSEWRSEGE